MTQTTKLMPATLKSYRDARNMTQQALADKVGCSKDTLSRWERGKSDAMHPRLKDRLCEALGVEWPVLCRPYEGDQSGAETEKPKPKFPRPKIRIEGSDGDEGPFGLGEHQRQLNVRLTAAEHNAFTTVSLRYSVSLGDLVRLAPLLFVIVAERSLTERAASISNLHPLSLELERDLPQFRFELSPRSVEREEESIERREVFAWDHWDNWQKEGLDPFVRCLKTLMSDDLGIRLVDGQGGAPLYDLDGMTRELLSLELAPDDDELFWSFLRSGEIVLREVYVKKTSLSPEAFREWLSAELARVLKTRDFDF